MARVPAALLTVFGLLSLAGLVTVQPHYTPQDAVDIQRALCRENGKQARQIAEMRDMGTSIARVLAIAPSVTQDAQILATQKRLVEFVYAQTWLTPWELFERVVTVCLKDPAMPLE